MFQNFPKVSVFQTPIKYQNENENCLCGRGLAWWFRVYIDNEIQNSYPTGLDLIESWGQLARCPSKMPCTST